MQLQEPVMPRITFIAPDGAAREVTVASGVSVMATAVAHGIPGIIGECGGLAMCTSCHVYVAEQWLDRVALPNEAENEMLECAANARHANSRLSCQIQMTEQLCGLVVYLPESQV
jgi:ferredoxin, 2Fe-2S